MRKLLFKPLLLLAALTLGLATATPKTCAAVPNSAKVADFQQNNTTSQRLAADCEANKNGNINISNLPVGNYFIRIKTEEGIVTEQIIKK